MLLARNLQKVNCSEHDVLNIQQGKDETRLNISISNDKTQWPTYSAMRIFNYFPEKRRLDMHNRYEVPATDISAELIHRFWPNEIRFHDEISEINYKLLLAKGQSHDFKAKLVADYRENGTLPSHKLEMSKQFPLARYQQVGLLASMHAESYHLFMEQGTGKTAVVIARINNEAKQFYAKHKRMYRVIIACPKNVRSNWEAEFVKFSTQCGKVEVIRGDQMTRFKQVLDCLKPEEGPNGVKTKFTVAVISYDSIDSIYAVIGGIEWDLAVLDESHYIKSSKTKRWKVAAKLRECCRQRMCLTGTPITNTPNDLWTQFEFGSKGGSGFVREKNFRDFYTHYIDVRGDGQQQFAGIQNVQFMKERLARYSFIIRKKDALPDLPDKVYDIHEVEMTAEQTEAYVRLQTQLVLEIENEMAGQKVSEELMVNNILTKMLKLTQITSGFVNFPEEYNDDGSVAKPASIYRFDPNPKIEELVNILKAKDKTDKTIIWASFVQDIKTLAARLRLEGIDCVTFYGATSDKERENAVERFNCDPDCRVFIGNAGAGGTGINLLGYDYKKTTNNPAAYETNANHIIYMSQDWSAVKRSQSEDRAHRRGTREPVRITDLMVAGTIDQQIRSRVVDKRNMAYSVSDIREILRKMNNNG